MGNIYSDNQICDCAVTGAISSNTRSGNSKKEHGTNVLSSTDMDRGNICKTRVRSLSASESKPSKVKVVGKTDILRAHSHGYQLRPRDKHGVVILGKRRDQINVSTVKSTRDAKSCNDDLTLLSSSLGTLSLDNDVTTNHVKDYERQAGSKSNRSGESCDTLELEMQLPKHVLYYGWFFSEETSSVIHRVVMHYFRMCYTHVPQFERFILTCCKDTDVRDPFEYYKRPGKKVKADDPIEYHITAKFLGRDPDPSYQILTHPFLHKSFRMHLIGLVFTPRTLGVRVKLSPAQQQIFDEKDESRNGRKLEDHTTLTKANKIRMQIEEEIEGYNITHKLHRKAHPNCKLKLKTFDKEGKEGIIYKRFQQEPTSNIIKSRAHITIGCAVGVRAVKTGEDLVEVLDLEQRNSTTTGNSNFQQDFKLERGVLRQFGKHADAFVLYSDMEMIVPARYDVFI